MVTLIRRFPAVFLLTLGLGVPALAYAAVKVTVKGVGGDLARNVSAYVGKPARQDPVSLRVFRKSVPGAARRAMEALGYYHATVRVEETREKTVTHFVVNVKPGPPVHVSKVELRIQGPAADDPAFKKLRDRLPIKPGGVLNQGEYEAAKRAITSTAALRGYFEGRFTVHRIAVNTRTNLAAIDLTYVSGPRYRLGHVHFQKSPLSEKLLQRFVPFKPGAAYSADDIAKLNKNLLDSQYFSNVGVEASPDRAQDHVIPVDVSLVPSPRNTIAAGVGFATDVGPRVNLNWTRPYVNSRGHSISVQTQLSAVNQNLTGTYSIPLSNPLTDSLQFKLGWQRQDVQDTLSEQYTATIQHQRLLPSKWTRTEFVQWQQERFQQGDQRGRTDLYMPGVSFARTRARGGVDPYWGDRLSLSVEGADTALASDISLFRVQASAKWLRTFWTRSRIYLRSDLGAIETNSFDQVPPSLRFFAGGDQSVRGFAYQSISPTDASGQAVGGRYLMVGSVEYDYQFLPKWRVATFVDAGKVFNKVFTPFSVGTGFGLRWISPVGPVRLDLAFAVSEPGAPWRIHFSMGPEL